MYKKTIMLSGFILMATLQGCISMMNPIGEAKFDCNRKQDAKSPYCRSFRSVEMSTNGEIPPSRFDKEFKMSDLDRMTGIAPDESNDQQSNATDKPILLPHQSYFDGKPLTGAPVRDGPVIQRVWIKRFVDGGDLLTENTIVYKEIRGTRWHGFGDTEERVSKTKTYPYRATGESAQAKQFNETRPLSQAELSQPGSPTEFTESANDPAASGISLSTSMPQ